jgi:hypothetical protein
MAIPIKSKAVDKPTDEIAVAEILESWSIEDIRQLIREIETELRSRAAPRRGAPRSRRARCPRGDPASRADARAR